VQFKLRLGIVVLIVFHLTFTRFVGNFCSFSLVVSYIIHVNRVHITKAF